MGVSVLEDLEFLRLTEDDLESVKELYDAERDVVTNMDKMKQTFKKIKDNHDYQMITVKFNGELVGFAKVIVHHDIFEENNPFLTIWSVRVKKEYRRMGVGTKLFRYIEDFAHSLNCEFMCLFADKDNIPANKFYKSLGYEEDYGFVKWMGN